MTSGTWKGRCWRDYCGRRHCGNAVRVRDAALAHVMLRHVDGRQMSPLHTDDVPSGIFPQHSLTGEADGGGVLQSLIRAFTYRR
jgi:hypothetical protein